MRVPFDSLTCRSAFDLTSRDARALDLGRGSSGPGVRLVELDDVLYLPNVLEPGQSLCIADSCTVPVESILDCWSIGFFREQKQLPQHAATYADNIVTEVLSEPACVLGNLFSRNF